MTKTTTPGETRDELTLDTGPHSEQGPGRPAVVAKIKGASPMPRARTLYDKKTRLVNTPVGALRGNSNGSNAGPLRG
jgi:hypothetical protein